MADPDQRLRAVLTGAVPEPVRRIDAADVRRRATRQRRRAAAVAVTVAAVTAVAVVVPAVLLGGGGGSARLVGPPTATAPPVSGATVTVTPDQGLRDGQRVQVVVRGFPAGSKVWLSECADAAQANPVGCGVQLAQQPFLVTDDNGAGTRPFTVSGFGPRPIGTVGAVNRCGSCVLVATTGAGSRNSTFTTAPLSFGPAGAGAHGSGAVLGVRSDNKLVLSWPARAVPTAT